MSAGAYTLWPADKDRKQIGYQPGENGESKTLPNPSDPAAVDIYFGVRQENSEPPPKAQVELKDQIRKVLRTIQVLYRADDDAAAEWQKSRFRSYFVRLFSLGQIGLEGPNASPEIASAALSATIADLIDDEAANIKNTHLRKLGLHALPIGSGCIALYILLKITDRYWPLARDFLLNIGIQASLLANFMMLIAGSLLGVWLSYGIRTTKVTLSDLTVTDADYLTPRIRLIFAGALTTVLGILFVIPVLELKIGEVSLTAIASDPMCAFVVGCFCGISELTLPSAVAKRASDFVANIS